MSIPAEKIVSHSDDAAKRRAKWITLSVLLVWVAAVFVATLLKFAKVW